MILNLCKLRVNARLSRICFANIAMYSKRPPSSTKSSISVSEINIADLARDDKEFYRNFMLTGLTLNKSIMAAVGDTNQPEIPSETDTKTGDTGETTIVGRDGLPIVPIEIDGWKQLGDNTEDGITVQNSSDSIEIGDDLDYQRERDLVVPEKREGYAEYKGMKVRLPDNASQDIGTYRFRRDKEDKETLGDDIRLAKFEK